MSQLVRPHQMVPEHYSYREPEHSAFHLDQLRRHSNLATPYQHVVSPTSRRFPNAAPQPVRSPLGVPNLPHEHHGEHSLRRKTPNGTIDNGYDGSSAHLASGPPPLKHMVLPSVHHMFPTARLKLGSSSNAQPSAAAGGWAYTGATSMKMAGQREMNTAPATPWGMGQTGMALNPSPRDCMPLMQHVPQPSFRSGMSLHAAMGPSYPQTAMYNAVGYQSNGGVWMGAAQVPLANAYTPQNAVVDSVFMPPQATLHPGLLNAPGPWQMHHPFSMPLPGHALDDGFSRHGRRQSVLQIPRQRLETLSLGPDVGDMRSSAQFKDQALSVAHKVYGDLLIYLNRTKKTHQGLTGSSLRPASRMVFPKPPKQSSASSYGPYYGQMKAATQMLGFGGPSAEAHSPTQSVSSAGNRALVVPMSGFAAASPPGFASGSPVQRAKSSLEVLASLCEQSNWKWVDGMLLGGCLQYDLEHYEEALEWFRRIVNLDSTHVEAISNMAATLYCLNRHDEAEHHWWQAIKTKPSHLEAAEQLVGLLCSKQRNQEAVNVIEYMQRALRISTTSALRDHVGETATEADTASATCAREKGAGSLSLDADASSPDTMFSSMTDGTQPPGFGSSGYRIPGSENGRILLLMHVKGNMLYQLKNIEGACRAFEESVLVSVGRNVQGVKSLIRRIQSVLAPGSVANAASEGALQGPTAMALLLPPEKAKHTARLVFETSDGRLPGLVYVPEGSHGSKSAVATTSNSLLSLAKIFQDTMSHGGSGLSPMRQPAGVGDILSLYYLSLSLQESPSTANNVGILLASVQQSASQLMSACDGVVATMIPGIQPGSGLALALAYYKYGLSLDPRHVHLHTNLGSLLKDIGQLDLAISMYEQAVACAPNFDIALTNLANAVKDKGRISDAIVYYKRAVASNPDFAEAVCGLSTALNSVCDWRGRGGTLLHHGRFDRWHVDEAGMPQDVCLLGKGSGLMKRVVDFVGRQLKEASTWGLGILTESTIRQLASDLRNAGGDMTDRSLDIETELRKWAGQAWEGSRVLRLIERSIRAAMRCWYQDRHVNKLQSPKRYLRPRVPASLSIPPAPTVLPFHTFTCPLTAKDMRMISERNALRISSSTLRSPWLPATVYEPPAPPSPHLNIGYLSSDFNNHPLAHLMQSVFGFHDQKRVKAFCYATTASDKSVHRQQIEREAPVFRDVSSWPSNRLVEQIVQDGIHILVNLNGYTRGARNEIFAARPAPIQMSFMGFAGTLGAEWCDYLLADATAIPSATLRPNRQNLALADVFTDAPTGDKEDWVYAENIVYSRDSFFCCDHAQAPDAANDRTMTWAEEQQRRWRMRKVLFPNLPDDVIILGNFNQLYKIDPTTFRTWLRILAAVPKAVLWLLRFPDLGETNLRRTALEWAGETVASRIIFTDVASKQHHISRARVCDLFLDTPECNAHTTAADVLWSSTPLLTLPRYQYKMCSRMAASILRGALPKNEEGERAASELVADDDAAYEKMGVTLGAGLKYRLVASSDGLTEHGEGVGRLAEMRKLLWESKWTCGLFDTRRWVRNLEYAYEEAWRRWVVGTGGDIYL